MADRKAGRLIKLFVGLVLCMGSHFAFAQTPFVQTLSKHNWYFGNSVNGIRFNRGTNKAQFVSNQAIPFGTGGSAVVTDPSTANLFFYTDGNKVFDAYHQQMPNGTGLSGNTSANQPAVVCAIPGQPDKYFIFTNTANYTTGGTVSYSIVDMTLFGNAAFPAPASGDVANPKNNAIPGLNNRSEGMIIVPHANGTDYWLITQQVNSQNYSATQINAASFTGTFVTITTSGIALPTSTANFSYHEATKKLAVSPQDPSTDAIILNFNDATGALNFDRYIYNTGVAATTNQNVYDIEWDPKGQYLYISRTGETGINANVFQYDYASPSVTLTPVFKGSIFRSYGLQIAPDSAIYHLYQAASGGPFLIGKFTKVDTIASLVVHTPLPFGNTDVKATQFPAFIPKANPNLTVDFNFAGTCQNSPTSFFPIIAPNADSLNWDFGDSSDTTVWSPIHTYATAQTFNVKLTAYYQGQQRQITKPVTITAFPLQVQLVQDTTACSCELPFPKAKGVTPCNPKFSVSLKIQGGTPTSVVWSNGDTGNTLTPDSLGYYYAVVTDASGCSTYAGVNVKEYGVQDQRANIWYFGNKAGINFNVSPAIPLDKSIMNAPEGCAIVCDRNGAVVFYTDGDKVFDKTNTQIDVGIGGDPLASQSALIFAVPGDETLFYIFTTKATGSSPPYELRYSLFDLKQNSGKGAVTQKNILLFTKSTERITANGRWLIAHEYGNSTFRAYPISAIGIGSPVYSDIGSIHSFQTSQNAEGYMKLGPKNFLAVALSTPGTSNLVELFHFNDTTGVVNNYRKIDLKEPTGQVYGLEFSSGANKLFATVKGTPTPSEIFEYMIDSVGKPYFKQKVQRPVEMGALQIAPDGQIYMAIKGSNVLGTIQANEDTTRLSSFNFSGFSLKSGTTSQLGLPNFIQQQGNSFGGPSFSYTGTCFGDSTKFVGNPTDAIDTFQWSFGDGASSTEASPAHLYAAPGTYTVTLVINNRCLQKEGKSPYTLIQQVKINPKPALPTVNPAAALCNGAVTLDANTGNIPNLTYLWTTGETTKQIVVSQPSIVSVTNTDKNGCSSTAQSIIVDNRPVVDLGPDITICEDNATPALNAQNPGANYQWSINGVVTSTIQSQFVDTSVPGVYTYQVIVTDPVTTCTVTDQKEYTVKVSPAFTFSGTNPTSCGGTNGSVTLNLSTSSPAGGPLYSYFLTGPGGFNKQGIDQSAPSTNTFTSPANAIAAGTYSAIVTDQVSGCTLSSSIGLSSPSFTATATASTCNPSVVTVSNTGGTAPFSYTFTNSGTGAVTGPQASNTASLVPGTYVIQVDDNSSPRCTFTFNRVVNPVVPVVTITPNLCSNPATLTATVAGGTAFAWTGPGIVGAANAATININAGGTYQVAATIGGGCVLTQTTTITYTGPLVPDFTQSSACQNSVVLTATPSGSFTYRWYKGGVFQSALLGRQISLGLSENGSTYQVEVVDAVSGCIVKSAAKAVQVIGPVDAFLISSPPCLDGKPFNLSASSTATGVTYNWFLNNTAITGLSTPAPAVIAQTADGTYKVEVSKGACKATAQIRITKAPLPVGKLLDRVVICNDPDNLDPLTSKVDLDPGVFTAYEWFKTTGSNITTPLNYFNQVFTADQPATYSVEITNSFGCKDTDKTEVRNDCQPKIVAPNAFKPSSNESKNKNFFVYSFFITDDFEVLIYNRWGELVYQSKDRDFKWNGGYNNNASELLPGGTYAYIIKYVSSFRPEKGIQEQRGGVVLIR